jgi:hypothetical protein
VVYYADWKLDSSAIDLSGLPSRQVLYVYKNTNVAFRGPIIGRTELGLRTFVPTEYNMYPGSSQLVMIPILAMKEAADTSKPGERQNGKASNHLPPYEAINFGHVTGTNLK